MTVSKIQNGISQRTSSSGNIAGYQIPDIEDEKVHYDPIVIVGMACRLPGAKNVSELWDVLSQGRSGQGPIPPDRFNADGFYHPNGATRPGSVNTQGGYFIDEDIRLFDNAFFGINNLEATYMDPQQRKLLEVVYECFESSGTTLEAISGARIGCYVGNFTTDYLISSCANPENLHRYSATGMGHPVLANRVSYTFNLKGPSAAVVGGANLVQSPYQHFAISKAGVLSSTSTCHTFDASADGYGRADAIGALHIKKLSAALRNRDPIRAVIRGTAVNSNGRTTGITLPSAVDQEIVIRKAYQQAGISLDETQYVECHGTGTPVGDPIEVEAVWKAFRKGKENMRPLLIGSVKTNLGHGEGVSTISSIIKCVLGMEHGQIPATIGIKQLNPKLSLEDRCLQVVTSSTSWPQSSTVKRAGINSFGYGGANGHIIIEESTSVVESVFFKSSLVSARRQMLLPISGANEEALESVRSKVVAALPGANLPDLAYTLGCRTSNLNHRGFLITEQSEASSPAIIGSFISASVVGTLARPLMFVFTGQGAQYPQMGRELIEAFPVFRCSLRKLDAVLSKLPKSPTWTIEESLLQPLETSQIHDVSLAQPLCTAIQIALVDLLRSWGLSPSAVVGHSSGEIAASYAAGFISAAEAIATAYYRGFAVSHVLTEGAMVAASLGHEEARQLIADNGLSNELTVACINSPESVTISGDRGAADKLCLVLNQQGHTARVLRTNGRAYHSKHMHQIGSLYEKLLFSYIEMHHSPCPPQNSVQFVSSVTGKELCQEDMTPAYWRNNLESPVQFSRALTKSYNTDYSFIEVGPHPTLALPVRQTCEKPGSTLPYHSLLKRGSNSVKTALSCAGNLYNEGYVIDFESLNGGDEMMDSHVNANGSGTGDGSAHAKGHSPRILPRVIPDLHLTHWKYGEPLWRESRESARFRFRKFPKHDLLGSISPSGSSAHVEWLNVLHPKNVPWLADHKLGENSIFPCAGYIAMMVEAMMQLHSDDLQSQPDCSLVLEGLHLTKALSLDFDDNAYGVDVSTVAQLERLTDVTKSRCRWEFIIGSETVENGKTQYTQHATAIGYLDYGGKMAAPLVLGKKHKAETVSKWYQRFSEQGLVFGPSFQSILSLEVPKEKDQRWACAETHISPTTESHRRKGIDMAIHPISMDCLLQTGLIATSSGRCDNLRGFIPVRIEEVRLRSWASESLAQDNFLVNSIADKAEVGFPIAHSDLLLPSCFDQEPVLQFRGIGISSAQGFVKTPTFTERTPILHQEWRLDVTLSTAPLSLEEGNQQLIVAVEALVRKSPFLDILYLRSRSEPAEELESLFDVMTIRRPFKMYRTFSDGILTDNGKLLVRRIEGSTDLTSYEDFRETKEKESFNLVIIPESWKSDLPFPVGCIAINCHILTRTSDPGRLIETLKASNRKVKSRELSPQISLTRVSPDGGEDSPGRFLIKFTGQSCQVLDLSKVEASSFDTHTTVISLVELDTWILSRMVPEDMESLRTILANSKSLIWVTHGDIFKGSNPETSIATGLFRSLRLEYLTVGLFTLVVDDIVNDHREAAEHILSILSQSHGPCPIDLEFVQYKKRLYINRFVPDNELSNSFLQRLGKVKRWTEWDDAKPCVLNMEDIGQLESIYFRQIEELPTILPPGRVELEVTCVGLNAKDIYVLGGRIETHKGTCALECTGVITKIGNAVTNVAVGDRVVCMGPSDFASHQQVASWQCAKLEDNELDESVLIHSGAGGLGIAAIQVAKLIGADIFVTVGSDAKRSFLVESFGINPNHIFNSRESSFADGILAITGGRGVDVVLNSLVGELLHESWRICGKFGRFVEVGKRDILDGGKLGLSHFKDCGTFTAFDLSEMFYSEDTKLHNLASSLLSETLSLFRDGCITAVNPIQVFDIANVSKAYRQFSSSNRIGKIAVSLKNGKSLVQAQARRYYAKFHPQKTYFLVGCLGGIGRSLSTWMMERGARKFLFLGRTGLQKKPAQELVRQLLEAGAVVNVVAGDVCEMGDVEKAVATIDGPLGGVVQAAMGLNEALFEQMSSSAWHTALDPKVRGTWNLHHAIEHRSEELDFFLMTSSISGALGTATESNYSAANVFLDAFAAYRRGLGRPATSVGLGMIADVGYLHENPEIQQILLRRGLQPINEEELLEILDIALSMPQSNFGLDQPLTARTSAFDGGFLTGLEFNHFVGIHGKGKEQEPLALQDPRCAIVATGLKGQDDGGNENNSDHLPPGLTAALNSSETAAAQIISSLVKKRFSSMILTSADSIRLTDSFASYGMDSMTAAEFRSWVF
ncbi:hypothetical protein FGADI_12109, partial [Fusarium gaditjirri]